MLTALGGGYRFAHSMLWNHGVEALKPMFGLAWLPLAASTLARFWNKIDSQVLVEQLGNASRLLTTQFVDWEGIKQDNLNLDFIAMARHRGRRQVIIPRYQADRHIIR